MNYSLSVVIPNYNNAQFLSQCLDSIIKQSYEGLLEIIIVDDCSTDNSKEIIENYARKYEKIRPVFLEKNSKVSAARNIGLNKVKGQYVTFIDSDDCYYNEDKLKNEMFIIEKYRNIGQDIIAYSSIVSMSNDGNEFKLPKIKKSAYLQGYIYKKLLLDIRSSLVMRDYCIKTDILKLLGGYNENNTLFEDYELLLKIAKEYHFYYTGEIGTAYRNSIDGLSKRPQKILISTKNKIAYTQICKEKLINREVLLIQRSIISFVKNIYRLIKS